MISASKPQLIGKQAEHYALHFLTNQGLALITRNWHCRFGEIDLIMLDGDTLVFVEVRYRKNNIFGSALESVTLRKQKKIMAAAQLFLLENSQWQQQDCRFDILALTTSAQNYACNWVQHAFSH